MDKITANNLDELKELSNIIDNSRKSFNHIVVRVCNRIAKELETSYISFKEVEVTQIDGYSNGINGYSLPEETFFCDDPNYPIDMDILTTKSIVKAMDTIIKTAKPYNEGE